MVMPDALGITHVSDLSPKDLEKVRSVAFLELTVTFDDHGIPLRPRRPAKVKSTPGKSDGKAYYKWRKSEWCIFFFFSSENSIFGVPLSTLLQNDQQRDPNVQIPVVFEEVSWLFIKFYQFLNFSFTLFSPPPPSLGTDVELPGE